jgi:hypothetical protein
MEFSQHGALQFTASICENMAFMDVTIPVVIEATLASCEPLSHSCGINVSATLAQASLNKLLSMCLQMASSSIVMLPLLAYVSLVFAASNTVIHSLRKHHIAPNAP